MPREPREWFSRRGRPIPSSKIPDCCVGVEVKGPKDNERCPRLRHCARPAVRTDVASSGETDSGEINVRLIKFAEKEGLGLFAPTRYKVRQSGLLHEELKVLDTPVPMLSFKKFTL